MLSIAKLAVLASYLLSKTVDASVDLTRRQSQLDNSAEYHIPIGSPGFQHNHSSAAVTFDQHSFFLNNERIMIYSGEFHPWRVPTGAVLWRDVLEKMKAAGFSGISVYFHWGATEFVPGTLDFNYFRSVTEFLDVAQSVGLLVVVRPGPYINAETNAGGLPGWLTNTAGTARTNATDYTEAWLPWITAVSKFVAPYQYPDGPVIAIQSENEFSVGTIESPYMQLIEDTYRANGLTKIPFTHNDGGAHGDYAAPGLGQVDAYGYDNYPLGFHCNHPTVWSEVPTNYDTNHQTYFPATPLWLNEFQGGSFDYWGGPGYEKCYQLINEEFANVYYKNTFASGTTLLSMYMVFGGTNWGNLATPVVYTSYDYGAPIREDRSLTTKYGEMKLQAHFMFSSPAFLTAVRIGNGTVGSGTAYSNSSSIFTTNLRDPTTDTNFYFVRQTTNTNTSPIQFSLQANTSAGTITVPQFGGSITLAGRESKIIVTNYAFGSSKLLYTTGEVFTWTTIDGVDYIVLYAIGGQSIEAVVGGTGRVQPAVTGSTTISARSVNGTTVIAGTTSGVSVIAVGKVKVLVVDKHTAYTFAQPRLSKSGYFNVGPATSSVLIYGPYLVRNATLSGNGETLSIVGDLNATTTVNIFAPKSVKTFTWNGAHLSTKKGPLGSSTGTIAFKYHSIAKLPSLAAAEWLCHDTFPELETSYDDATWTAANKTTVLRPNKPTAGKYVLYADEYGYHQGNLIFRGHFTGQNATTLSLAVQGGLNFGYSAYINSHFLGSGQGFSQNVTTSNGGIDLLNGTWALNSSLLSAGDNVVSVIMDNTGLDETGSNDAFKHPRGIRGYALSGADFDYWKIAGNYLGENFPDKVRGPLNEGGLWAEREGAHLPGYPATGWASSKSSNSCSPFVGITSGGATAYRTSFNLNLPTDADTPVALQFTPTTDTSTNTTSNYRAMIYINGWQFGKYTDNLGPQRVFPLPEGILNHRGKNELLVTLWSLDPQGAKIAGLELVTTAVVQSSKGYIPTIVTSPTYSQLR